MPFKAFKRIYGTSKLKKLPENGLKIKDAGGNDLGNKGTYLVPMQILGRIIGRMAKIRSSTKIRFTLQQPSVLHTKKRRNGYRIVQDFRELNQKLLMDKHPNPGRNMMNHDMEQLHRPEDIVLLRRQRKDHLRCRVHLRPDA